jgi:copper(I)-binding protein
MKFLFPAGALGAAVLLTVSGLTGGPASAQGAPAVQNSPSPVPPATGAQAGSLVIAEPWSRATPGGARIGGGYLRITNTGSVPDRLTGGSFALA